MRCKLNYMYAIFLPFACDNVWSAFTLRQTETKFFSDYNDNLIARSLDMNWRAGACGLAGYRPFHPGGLT